MWRSDDLLARLAKLPEPGTRVAPSGPASVEEDMRAPTRGDHDLAVIAVDGGALRSDEDDPLLSYEGAYRGLEVG